MPDSPFKRYGDVTELKAELISDDSVLNGKKALFAKIAPLDELVSMVRAGQKVYTSMGDPPELLEQRQVLSHRAGRHPMTRQASVPNTSNSAAAPRRTRSPVKKTSRAISSLWPHWQSWSLRTFPTPCSTA
ncbi:phage capsid scaffolding [Enterobacter cancerogenus]|uniref:Phage capsid scaffolding n=1 Tax=Enterobacter cancerogenus TaxID=69218 RepID=A0A484YNX6_9ENTR|nr:phage capsid scaffolding [Enterobacter cancerogenus]